ncbi:MAG: FAD binding domain-containing protein [Nocardioidaceae bacterium]
MAAADRLGRRGPPAVKPFTFHRPGSVAEAVDLLRDLGSTARPMAGGQSLLLELKDRRAQPTAIVSLAGLDELAGWEYAADGELHVGPTTTYARLAAATDLRGWHRQVAAVAGNLADRPVRTMGTIGGSLCQAEPRFDMPALVVGVGAQVDTAGPDGAGTRDAADLFKDTGGSRLQPGEILTRIRFPSAQTWSGVAYEKFRIRMFDQALASVTCAVAVGADGVVTGARLTVAAATPAPVVARTATDLLVGRDNGSGPGDLGAVVEALTDEILPAANATTQLRRYQRELVPTLARRAIVRAIEQSGS